MYSRKNFKIFDILVAAHDEQYTTDTNFQLPSSIQFITGIRLQSSYPERMRYAGRFGLKIDSTTIFEASSVFANLAAPYDDSFFDLKELSESKNGFVAGSRGFSMSYKDVYDAAYVPNPFVANYTVSVIVEFIEKR